MLYINNISTKRIINYFKILYSFFISRISKRYFLYGKPLFISVEISSLCNLQCPECVIGKRMTSRKNKFSDIDVYKKLISEIGDSLLCAIFYFQGEPLLNENIGEYIRIAKRYGIYTMTSTNGQLMTAEKAENIVESGLDRIIVSIDGISQESYQKYRKGGQLSKAIDAIRMLNKAKEKSGKKYPVIEVQFIVFRFNENEIDDFKKEALKWGADKAVIKSAQIEDPDSSPEMVTSIDKYCRYKKVNGKYVIKKSVEKACFRAWSGAVVTADSNIVPCCFDKKEEFIYGNLKDEENFISIWKGEKAVKFRSSLLADRKSFKICNNCNE